jgi:tRNA (cytidine/uridine-2'-O-)-methyltransferase
VVLYQPQIPQNTGTIARLCAAQRVPLHVVGRPNFRLDDRAVRRAGLDYWSEVVLHRHRDMEALLSTIREQTGAETRLVMFSTRANRPYCRFGFQPGDSLVFGPETMGLPVELLTQHAETAVRIPQFNPAVRSLNLAVSVAMGLGEALRQLGMGDWGRESEMGSSCPGIE